MGGWSIGIEMVFYVLLPFVVMMRPSPKALIIASAIVMVFSLAFVNFTLLGHQAFDADLWSAYTQPAAFAGYFVAGNAIGAFYNSAPRKSYAGVDPVSPDRRRLGLGTQAQELAW
jgi:peptidoglycan/LPS O-acetylase OafA/YrhL